MDRLLIVDDDPDVRQFCKSVLEHPSLLLGMAAAMGTGVLWIRKIITLDI